MDTMSSSPQLIIAHDGKFNEIKASNLTHFFLIDGKWHSLKFEKITEKKLIKELHKKKVPLK